MVDSHDLERLKADRTRLEAELEATGGRTKNNAVICPFHDDALPSGSIHQAESGAWLYTCHGCNWNDGKKTGDIIDVVRRANGCDFREAVEKLGLKTINERDSDITKCDKADRGDFDATAEAKAAHEALIGDSSALAHLWKTRAISEVIVRQFRVGVIGAPGRRYWTFPVADETGQIVAVKYHRADGQRRKSFWKPSGTKRDHLFPIFLEPPGPVWLCPGELKAIAVACAGKSAIGITSGEGSFNGATKRPTDLPPQTFELIGDRPVAIPPDADEGGRLWAEHARKQLADVGIEARIVRLPLRPNSGEDIGDYTVQLYENGKDTEAVAASLDAASQRAGPWYGTLIGDRWANPRMWQPVESITTGLRDLNAALDGGLRTRGVHILCGKTGQAKTQVAATLAVNAAISGMHVGYLSLELGADELAQLVAAQLADVPRNILARGQVVGENERRLQRALKRHHDMPLTILDEERWPEGMTRDRLGGLIADGVRVFNWRVIVLDYLGLVVPTPDERDQFTADIMNSTELRRLSRKHDIVLIVVASVRKGATSKKADDLTIDDLAGAGRLAYDAQNVFSVWCETRDRGTGLIYILPLKMRFSPNPKRPLRFRWHPATGRILDLETDSAGVTSRSS